MCFRSVSECICSQNQNQNVNGTRTIQALKRTREQKTETRTVKVQVLHLLVHINMVQVRNYTTLETSFNSQLEGEKVFLPVILIRSVSNFLV